MTFPTPPPPGPTWNPEQQTYDSTPPPHVGQPYPGQPEPRKPRKIWPARHPVWTSLGILAVLGFGIVAAASGGSPRTDVAAVPSTSPEPRITATESADGIQETTPPPPEVNIPKPADFTLGVKVLDKQCFGDAGCNMTVRLDFTRIAPSVPRNGTFEVTYEVRGVESGPVIGTIEVNDGDYSPPEEYVQTASSAKKVSAVVTATSVS